MTRNQHIFFAAFVSVGVMAGAIYSQQNMQTPSSASVVNTMASHSNHQQERMAQNIHAHTGSHASDEHDREVHGKPGADISNQNNARYFLDVHEQKEITLELKVEPTKGAFDVHIETDDGLMLVSGKSDWQYTLNGEQTFQFPVTLYGATEGTHYVHIFTTYTDEFGQVSSRALAQQVDVGVSSLEVNRYKSASAQTSPYVKLPVVEDIH